MSFDPFDPDGWFMRRSLHFDREGEPISMARWGELHVDDDYVAVNETQVGDAKVSTVWLGLDQGLPMRPEDPPVIFETMIFGGAYHHFQWRYRTEREAMEGHGAVVAALENGLDPDPYTDLGPVEDVQLPERGDGSAGTGA